jgi:ribosomal protein S18 acetylase RimI-like enzyme
MHPQKFRLDGAVHPAFQGRGIGSELLARVLEAVGARNAISLRTATREDYVTGCRFLARRGFVEARRAWVSALNLDRLGFGPDGDQADAWDIDAATAMEMDYFRANHLGSVAFLGRWPPRRPGR